MNNAITMPFEERMQHTTNPVARHLFSLVMEKKSTLSCSADVTTCEELLSLADAVGPHICLLKTHIDILSDFTPALIPKLTALAEKHQFLLFEDRKFADIGNTVRLQYESGIYKIASWAHIINAHGVPGEGIIEGLKQVGKEQGRALLLLAEMSSTGALTHGDYQNSVVEMGIKHQDFVIGYISTHNLTPEHPALLHFTPGVHLSQASDSLKQSYLTPEEVVARGSDVIIVGRGIYQSAAPQETARAYQEAAWSAYQKRVHSSPLPVNSA